MRYGFILLFLLMLAALPAHAADVHRCIGADGGAIFTDKLCENIGASVRPEPAARIIGTNSSGRVWAYAVAHALPTNCAVACKPRSTTAT